MGDASSTLAPESPKLLTLDKADVRAIRSFLPGKVLSRTAALLALVVLVLGFATSVDVAVERFLGFPLETPWLKHTILFGIQVLIVGALCGSFSAHSKSPAASKNGKRKASIGSNTSRSTVWRARLWTSTRLHCFSDAMVCSRRPSSPCAPTAWRVSSIISSKMRYESIHLN